MFATLLASALLAFIGQAPAETGSRDVTFENRAPSSEPTELVRRFAWPGQWRTQQQYELANERFHLRVPDTREPNGEPFGLLVWISPTPDGRVPPNYEAALDKHRLIWVSAHNTGNDRNLMQRLGLALDAAYNVPFQYDIDPERVYVAGLSGGGRCASHLGVNYSDIFRGALPIIGCNFYREVEPPSRPGKLWRAFHAPTPGMKKLAAMQPLVIVTGSGDGNREQCHTYAQAYEADGFTAVTYIEVQGMGHTYPPAETFDKALGHLDERDGPDEATLKRHDLADRRLDDALADLEDKPLVGKRKLRGLARSMPDTPAGRRARFIADRLDVGLPIEQD
ncbi:MAG: PHB depolymerase family esterase [Planctomycetota bacterium]